MVNDAKKKSHTRKAGWAQEDVGMSGKAPPTKVTRCAWCGGGGEL